MTNGECNGIHNRAGAKEGIQLKKLPDLTEVTKSNPMQKLLAQAVGLHLKTMRSDVGITQLGFENLVQFVELQLDDMLQILHRFANVQRRNEVSLKDVRLFLHGCGVEEESLYEEYVRSQYVRQQHAGAVRSIEEQSASLMGHWHQPMSEEELLSSSHAEFFFKDVDILNLVPPTNNNNHYVPKWLPEFPPDHTYKFTSIYNQPITDERQMKRKLFEESKLSEKALLHMLGTATKKPRADDAQLPQIISDGQQENLLIYGPERRRLAPEPAPTRGFNIEDYARCRVELARRRVEEFEQQKLQVQKNPFIRAAAACSPYATTRLSRKAIEREFGVLLHRSYIGVLHAIPRLRRTKARELAAAYERERARQESMRNNTDLTQQQHGVLDLSALHDDPLLADLDSSDSDDDRQPPSPRKPPDPTESDAPSPPTADTATPAPPSPLANPPVLDAAPEPLSVPPPIEKLGSPDTNAASAS
ncbi:ABL128Wp [Eremothecium gossypii ATCC 10895]|uniref:Transcription initiation factor TFIID subunit 8 n=1 Tax=Eremothecium gossypii (strain ATCC 10895 / CBS 109.51 / FGSC 9923 / NRRL Y-1056) TaxID=284811 RepID=Q75E01_EREGS|nr:ABL128Wp [Eremothecium gossypii ATCC 10895]AAS50643.1 ABL128Wp [Eremothecium gossypii ATCC 10895]AEY94931.1 FABL128Wp [Eremothecium gossypii FDAG1]